MSLLHWTPQQHLKSQVGWEMRYRPPEALLHSLWLKFNFISSSPWPCELGVKCSTFQWGKTEVTNCQWLAQGCTSGQCPLSLHLQADLYIWLSFCCATLCSTKFEQGLMHKDARNQMREIPAFTLRTAEKDMRQGYHDSTIRRCSSKEENTRQTSSEICPGSRRSSLSLETELISVLLIYLYNINIDVSSVLRVHFE